MCYKFYYELHSQFSHQHDSAVIMAIFMVMCAILVGTQFQPVQHTSPTRCIKTQHISAPSITPHRLKDCNSKDVNHNPFLTYICITRIILTKFIKLFNCYGVTATQLTKCVLFYCCNNNITLKMAAIPAETCS